MPNIECKKCSSINIVPEGAQSFTCNICGATQEIESEETGSGSYLDNTFLGETYSRSSFETVSAGNTSSEEKDYSAEPKSVSGNDVPPEDVIYYSAVARMNRNSINNYIRALEGLQSIPDWKDSAKLIAECQEKIAYFNEEQEKENAEKKRKINKRLAVILPFAIIIFLIAAVALCYVFIYRPNAQYKQALASENSGDIVSAYETYIDLKGYKDSTERAEQIYEKYKAEKLRCAQAGDIVYFGSYEQDNDTSNGKEDLKWKVLKKDGSRLFVISEYAIDCAVFNKTEKAVTWETSSIRQYLNSSFLNLAFTASQQDKILSTNVTAEKNGNYDTNPGRDTVDKVFLLSISEAEEWLSEEQRQCMPTDLCIAKGCNKQKKSRFSSEYTICWLLRSPGNKATKVAYVQYDGIIRVVGANVTAAGSTIRPAMWIKIGD